MSIMDLSDEITNFPESKCLLSYTKERMEKKLGMIMIFTGETGHGKSYAGLRLLELWYNLWFKETFPISHVCNSIEEAIIIARDVTRIGEGILIEELSVHAGRRDYATNQNKLWNKFIDICRIKQLIIVGNCPHISFIDSHFQLMCQVWVNCIKVDFDRKIVIAHPLWLQTSPHRTEPYKHKFQDEEGDEIDYCYFKIPSEELYKPYDKLKDASNDGLFSSILLKLTADKVKQLKKLGQKCLTDKEIQAWTYYLYGYPTDEAAKLMKFKGLRARDCYSNLINSIKNKLKQPQYEQIAKEMLRKDIISSRLIKNETEKATS